MRKFLVAVAVSGIGWAQAPAETQPTAAQPVATQSTPAQPTPAPSTAAQSTPAQPTPVPSTAAQSTTAQPRPTPSTAAQPAAAQATPAPSTAAQSTATQPTAQAAMAASVDKQRASVMKQVSALTGKAAPAATSFFTVPWIENTVQSNMSLNTAFNVPMVPPCDPLATDQLDHLIEQNSQQEGIKADLIRAVIKQESGNRPCAVSSKGAQGLMQLMPATAEQFGVHDPFDPKQNVEAGTKLLKQLLAKYSGDVSLALSAYNAGTGRVDRDGGIPAIPETVNYVSDILAKLPNF